MAKLRSQSYHISGEKTILCKKCIAVANSDFRVRTKEVRSQSHVLSTNDGKKYACESYNVGDEMWGHFLLYSTIGVHVQVPRGYIV